MKDMNKQSIGIDATGKSLGRIASESARYLQGKHLPSYKPNVPASVQVEVVNITSANANKKSSDLKVLYRSSMRPGGLKQTSFLDAFEKNPRETFRNIVAGMLPKNKLRKILLKHLTIR